MKKIHEKLKWVLESKILLGILYGIGSVFVLATVFSAGISVGFHKASFEKAWGDNYERNFGMMRGDMMDRFNGFQRELPNAHGAVGRIIKIELPTIIVADKDNTEKVVLIDETTQIQKMRTEIKSSDLKIDDFAVIIGAPDDKGQIDAKFIRVMPVGMPGNIPVPAPAN